jgi:hypothetical protein
MMTGLGARCPPLYELAAQEQQRPSAEGGSSIGGGGGKKQKRQGKAKAKAKKDESSTSSSPPSSSSFPASSSAAFFAPVEVELSDVPSAQAFREILYFIYTDEVRFSPKMTLSQLFELLALATRFRLDRFVRLCERYIMYAATLLARLGGSRGPGSHCVCAVCVVCCVCVCVRACVCVCVTDRRCRWTT